MIELTVTKLDVLYGQK